jgi:amino acid transporter
MATLTAQSAELTALLKNNPEPHRVEVEAAINIALIVLTTFSHCLGVIVSKIIYYLLLRLFNRMI